jgi:hypothetical protein
MKTEMKKAVKQMGFAANNLQPAEGPYPDLNRVVRQLLLALASLFRHGETYQPQVQGCVAAVADQFATHEIRWQDQDGIETVIKTDFETACNLFDALRDSSAVFYVSQKRNGTQYKLELRVGGTKVNAERKAVGMKVDRKAEKLLRPKNKKKRPKNKKKSRDVSRWINPQTPEDRISYLHTAARMRYEDSKMESDAVDGAREDAKRIGATDEELREALTRFDADFFFGSRWLAELGY